MGAALQVIQDSAAAGTILQPDRLKLLELLNEPDSASGLARKLGLPRQKVNYHIQQLERDGFLQLVEERRKGNCTERVLRATARCYVMSPTVLGALGERRDGESVDRLSSAYLVSTAARTVRDVAILRSRANRAGKKLATLTIETEVRFGSAEARAGFAEELASEVARLTAKYHDTKAPGGRSFRFTLGAYPVLTHSREQDDLKPVRMD